MFNLFKVTVAPCDLGGGRLPLSAPGLGNPLSWEKNGEGPPEAYVLAWHHFVQDPGTDLRLKVAPDSIL